MLKEVKRDLDDLMNDVEKYIVNEEKVYLRTPLRYRFEIIRDKYEKKCGSEIFGKTRQEIDNGLMMMEAILY